jgi:branched-chain amino acid transport system permease protein
VEHALMEQFLQATINGLGNGAIYALAALGFVIIFKASRVINFAQGEFLLIGSYLVLTGVAILGLPWPIALLGAVVVAALIGLVTERLTLRPMIGEDPIAVIMLTIGLSSLFAGVIQMLYGARPRQMPAVLPRGTLEIAGVTISYDTLSAIAIAAIVFAAIGLFFSRTRHGIAMRAVADDQQAALTMGISVGRVFSFAWTIAAATAVFAGLIVANSFQINPVAVTGFGLLVFPVVIVGGLDSVAGAAVGGAVVGLLNQYTATYAPPQLGLTAVVPYVVLLLILLVRPYGLFGEVRIERV